MITSTKDAILRIKPALVLQKLGEIKVPDTEIMTNVFKNKPTINDSSVAKSVTAETLRAIPYVGKTNPGVRLQGKVITTEAITVPPMKAQMTVTAADIEASRELQGMEFQAWLREKLVTVRATVSANMEWYARHFLATGSCAYPYWVDETMQAITYALGTMTTVSGPPSVLFDAATATLTDVILHLDLMRKTGQDVAARGHFNEPSKIITYARSAVWNAIYDILDGKQTTNVVSGRRDGDDLYVGPYKVRKFDAEWINPTDQLADNAITAKHMRMIDTGFTAPHTMASLRLDNLNATGGQKFVYVGVIPDPHGNFVDIDVQWRPCGLFIPEAMVDSDAVIS